MNTYPPTAKQVRDYMEKHGLTRRAVAAMVQCEPRTVSHWKSGTRNMPYSIYFALRTKVEGKPPE